MKQLEAGLAETQHAIHSLDRTAKELIQTLGVLTREAGKARDELNALIDLMLERQMLLERFGENANG